MPNPGNPQTLNRYAYANNNPILYTDPSGHFGFKSIKNSLKRFENFTFKNRDYFTLGHSILADKALTNKTVGPFVRIVALAAASYYGGPWAAAGGQAYLTRLDGGSTRDAVIAGGISVASAYAGQAANQLGTAAGTQYGPYAGSAVRVAGRGLVGGGISSIRGGSFTTGFAFAAGTAFANDTYRAISGFPGISYRTGGPVSQKSLDGSNDAIWGNDNVGNAATTPDLLKNPPALTEGGWAASILSWVPGVQPESGFHDELLGPNFLGMSGATNYPTMLPSLAGSLDQVWVGGLGGQNVDVSTIILNQR